MFCLGSWAIINVEIKTKMVVNIKGISSNHPFLDKINRPKHVSV